MSLTWLRALTMNLRLLLHRRQRLSTNLWDQRRLWHFVVNCVWDSSCFCSSYGCSVKWEAVGQDTIPPITVPGEGIPGAGVPGEAALGAFLREVSPRVEVEAFRVLACEGEAVVVAQDARINT